MLTVDPCHMHVTIAVEDDGVLHHGDPLSTATHSARSRSMMACLSFPSAAKRVAVP